MILPTWTIEQKCIVDNYSAVIGVDEVGRGPLVGPVVAAAAVVRDATLYSMSVEDLYAHDDRWRLVRDSKSLSIKQRTIARDFVEEQFITAIGLCDHVTIDRINILEASFLAMKKAIQILQKQIPSEQFIALIDGDKVMPSYSGVQRAVPQGDQNVMSIAAASIIAKVTRDAMMVALHQQYPQYGFDKHKGYGTRQHMEALRRYGPTPLHRKSFKPVRKILRDLRAHGADV